MAVTQPRLADVARTLTESTLNGKIAWEADPDDDTSFGYSTSAGSIWIDSSDSDGAAPYRLAVYNKDGNEIDSLRTGFIKHEALLSIALQAPSAPAPWNDLLRDLFEAARRSARNTDAVIDAILASVDNPGGE